MSRASRSAFAGAAPSRSFESSPSPSLASPPPIRSPDDVDESRRPFPHLPLRLGIEVEAELRDEAETAHDSQRIVLEAQRARRPQDPALEVAAPAERIDQLARRQAARDRVHREVAPGHVLAQRDRGVGGDLEVVAARPRRALDARRRELDPGRLKGPRLPVSRKEAHADPLLRDDQILDLPVRLERRAQLGVTDPGHDEVAFLDGQPEQLVANRAADEVGVEPERMDVVGD